MNKAIKAALLSALVFPGLGQMYLKRYVRGLIPMALTLIGLGVWVVDATVRALQELDRIQIQGGLIDPNAIAGRVAASSASGGWYSPLLLPMIIVCWLISVIDAYMLGKRVADQPGSGEGRMGDSRANPDENDNFKQN
jgi:hypothetical protein